MHEETVQAEQSSAYNKWFALWPLIEQPEKDSLSLTLKSSILSTYNIEAKMPPCLTPLDTLKDVDKHPHHFT